MDFDFAKVVEASKDNPVFYVQYAHARIRSLHRKVAAEVAAQQEMETALRWASVDNRPLYNRYRHTKKKRIRKKYAKRILEWYRTEVAPC